MPLRPRSWPIILFAIAAKLKQRPEADFRGRHYEAALIVQAVSWYLRYPLSYRHIEGMFLECGLEVNHSTLNRWVLVYAPLVEKRLRQFRRPHADRFGSTKPTSTCVDSGATSTAPSTSMGRRFFRKMLENQPLLAPDRIGTDGAGPYPSAIAESRTEGLLPRALTHYVTKYL